MTLITSSLVQPVSTLPDSLVTYYSFPDYGIGEWHRCGYCAITFRDSDYAQHFGERVSEIGATLVRVDDIRGIVVIERPSESMTACLILMTRLADDVIGEAETYILDAHFEDARYDDLPF